MIRTADLPPFEVPAGSPSWVTPELVASTIRTWQPHYGELLTPADAVDILRAVGGLVSITAPHLGNKQ